MALSLSLRIGQRLTGVPRDVLVTAFAADVVLPSPVVTIRITIIICDAAVSNGVIRTGLLPIQSTVTFIICIVARTSTLHCISGVRRATMAQNCNNDNGEGK